MIDFVGVAMGLGLDRLIVLIVFVNLNCLRNLQGLRELLLLNLKCEWRERGERFLRREQRRHQHPCFIGILEGGLRRDWTLFYVIRWGEGGIVVYFVILIT